MPAAVLSGSSQLSYFCGLSDEAGTSTVIFLVTTDDVISTPVDIVPVIDVPGRSRERVRLRPRRVEICDPNGYRIELRQWFR